MARAVWAVACPIVAMTLAVLAIPATLLAAWPEVGTEDPKPATLTSPARKPDPKAETKTEARPAAKGTPAETKDGKSATNAAAAPSAPAKAEASASQGGPQYRIGPEDQLHVSVWENKELTIDVMVRPDGKISVPLIQDVQAEGLTASELAEIIRARLAAFIQDPQVAVIVLQVNAPKIFIIGNVAKPGPYLLRSDTTVVQALSLAGGFTQFASPRSIKLVRGTGAKQEVRKINYYHAIDDGGEGNLILKPGDTIVVP